MSFRTYLSYLYPSMLWEIPSIVPGLILYALAIATLKRKDHLRFINLTAATIISMALPLLATFQSYTGTGGARIGLVFMFLPFYTSILGIVSLIIGGFIIKKIGSNDATRAPRTSLIIISTVMIISFLTFAFLSAHDGVYMSLAEKSTDATELTYLYKKAERLDDSGIYLFLAQNPSLSSDLLEKMHQVHYPHIRVFIAKHQNTPTPIIAIMTEDDCDYVRTAAKEELSRRIKRQKLYNKI